MHENRKSKGCFQCPRLSLAESSSTLISSGFSMVVDCFFRVLPMTALRSLPISLSSITMVCCYCFVVFVFVPRVFSGNRELSWRVTSLLKLPHCLSSLRFKLSLRLEKQEELLSAYAERAYLFDGHSNDNAYLVLSWYLWYSYLQMETIFLVQWNREMVSFSQFTTEINQTWPSRDPTQGLLDTTLKPDLSLKTASLEAIFMKNQALEKWVWTQGRWEFEDHLLCI